MIEKKSLIHERYIRSDLDRVCTCILTYDDQEFYGTAKCHPNDEDMRNNTVGEILAFNRAYICLLRYMRKMEVEIPLQALENLYKNMQTSYRFNEKSFEGKQLYREIKAFKEAKETINNTIKQVKEYNNYFIDSKEAYYQGIRKSREEKAKAVLD